MSLVNIDQSGCSGRSISTVGANGRLCVPTRRPSIFGLMVFFVSHTENTTPCAKTWSYGHYTLRELHVARNNLVRTSDRI